MGQQALRLLPCPQLGQSELQQRQVTWRVLDGVEDAPNQTCLELASGTEGRLFNRGTSLISGHGQHVDLASIHVPAELFVSQ